MNLEKFGLEDDDNFRKSFFASMEIENIWKNDDWGWNECRDGDNSLLKENIKGLIKKYKNK